MAVGLSHVLAPDPLALAMAVVVDLAVGDPVYPLHPVRLMGWTLARVEAGLRSVGADGRTGGVLLFGLLAGVWGGGLSLAVVAASAADWRAGWLLHAFLVYSCIALGDLRRHVRRIDRAAAAGNLPSARRAVSALVGRDTDRMDEAACRRAGVESLAENVTDGFISPICWYAVGGLPGLIVFKVVSTMDSMVGYKTPRYLRFGWCGARLDDAMNYVPARLTWLVMVGLAWLLPGYSWRKAWRVGMAQHGLLPGPNSGWSEAAVAGAIERRLVGPIWTNGSLVTDLWIGDPGDPPVEDGADVRRALVFVTAAGLVSVASICGLLWLIACACVQLGTL